MSTPRSVPFQCAIASLYVNGTLVVSDGAGCAQGFFHFFAAPWVPNDYPSGTQLCVQGYMGRWQAM